MHKVIYIKLDFWNETYKFTSRLKTSFKLYIRKAKNIAPSCSPVRHALGKI